MKYVSTRGEAPALGFTGVLLQGLAEDGGLYVPEAWPRLTADDIAALAGRPYARVAERVISPFVGEAIAPEPLRAMIEEAYATFRHPAVAPLVQTGPNDFVLELFHGTTLAFKDVAMQLLARLMDHALQARGGRATIVGATSGDTGGAAIDAFRGRDRVDVFILYPHGRVSEVQRRQMTTPTGGNVHAIAVEGTFDDCQRIVKALFADEPFRRSVALSGVNSINWARIVAQIVYYFTAAVALGSPHRKVGFCVPTGNFGDVFAGYGASRMGLPVDRLIVATNVNDILQRTISTGRYEVRQVVHTSSPSMDIQVSSNFERLIFEASGRDADAVRGYMAGLAQSGAFTLDERTLREIGRLFEGSRVDEADCAATMAALKREVGYLADPHSAVALAAAARREGQADVPMVSLATAHPAKFPDAVEAATGVRPALPDWLGDLFEREERFDVLPAETSGIAGFISARSRAAAAEVRP